MLWSPSGSLVVEAEELVGGSSSELADVFPRTIPPPGCGAEVLELAVAAKVLHSPPPWWNALELAPDVCPDVRKVLAGASQGTVFAQGFCIIPLDSIGAA